MKTLKNLLSKTAKFFDRKPFVGLAMIIAIFLGVTLPTLAKASIWFDEAYTAYIIRHNFAEIWHFTSVDVHPPLYYFVLKIWSLIFGSSDFALRAMSVFFGVLTIWAAFSLVRKIFKSNKTALISALFLAISPMFLRYAQEARMYLMVAFFAVMAVRAYFEIYFEKNSDKAKKRWQIAFVAFSAAGIWTQYLSGLTVVALWLWRIFENRKQLFSKNFKEFFSRVFGEKWFALNLWILAAFLPWIPFFAIQAISVKSGFWIQDLSFNTLPNYISNFFTFQNSGDLNAWWCLVIFAIFGVIWAVISKISKKKPVELSFFGAMAILPPVVLFLLSLPPAKSIFVDRYALSGMVFSSLFLGILISKGFSKNAKLSFFATVLILAASIYGIYEIDRQSGFSKTSNSTTDTRQIVDFVRAKSGENEPIIATSGYFYYEIAQYNSAKNPTFFTAEQDYRVGSLKMLEQKNDEKISNFAEFSKKYPKVWVIYNYGETEKPPLDKSWKLEFEQKFEDRIIGGNRYLVQRFSTQK